MTEARVITGLKMALDAVDADTQDRYTQAMIKRATEIVARSRAADMPDLSSDKMREEAGAIRDGQSADRKALRELVEAKLRIFNPDYLTQK